MCLNGNVPMISHTKTHRYHYTFDLSQKEALDAIIDKYNRECAVFKTAYMQTVSYYKFDMNGNDNKYVCADVLIVNCFDNIDHLFDNHKWLRRKVDLSLNDDNITSDIKYFEHHIELKYTDRITKDSRLNDLRYIASLLWERFGIKCLYSMKSNERPYVSFQTDTTESYTMILSTVSYAILNIGRHNVALSDISSRFKMCIEDSAGPGVFNTDGYINAKLVVNNLASAESE